MEAPKMIGADEIALTISYPAAEKAAAVAETSKITKEIKNLELTPSSSPGTSWLTTPPPYQSPKPPSEDGFLRRPSFRQMGGSTPKSRLVEPPYPTKIKSVQATTIQIPAKTSPLRSPVGGFIRESKMADDLITPKTPLMASPIGRGDGDGDGDDDDDSVCTTSYVKKPAQEVKKIKFIPLVEWILLISIIGVLIASLTIVKLKNHYVWGLRLWRWFILLLVVFCGHLVTQWLMDVLVILIEKNFMLKKKVLYFVYGLRRSVRVFAWLGLILLAWGLLIAHGVKRSRKTTRILNYITRGLACSLIGAAMWMVKTFLVKLLASSFHVKTYFDKIHVSFFSQYVLQTLSGPPLLKKSGGTLKRSGSMSVKISNVGNQKGKGEEVIDVDKLYRMKKEKISSGTMGGLIQVVRSSGLLTISEVLDDVEDDEGIAQKELASEFEARTAAKQIFQKVAKPRKDYIEEEDLLLYMPKEEADAVLQMFDGSAATGHIKESAFRSWVVKVYNERKYLVHSLNDSKTAIEELNKIASGFILLVIIIVWLLLMGFATTQVLVFISSQLLLVVFMFGSTCKVVFEAIIFLFITHPFDVGDRCVVDGVQMVVEEMNILTTVFLRYDNEMIYYPNAVLATKPISNFNRSPEMGDSVEFAVDFSTSVQSIAALKAKIKAYLESKPQHWRPGHSVVIKEIENVNKLKMALNVSHTINFQNSFERSSRRSDLVLELKNIFEELGIKFHLLPQEVIVKYVAPENQRSSTATEL